MDDYQHCSICKFATTKSSLLLKHLTMAHHNDPKAKPQCMYCPWTSYNKNSMLNHVRKNHPEHSGVTPPKEPLVVEDLGEPILGEEATQQDWLSYYEMIIAKYLIKFEARYKTTKTMIDDIVELICSFGGSLLKEAGANDKSSELLLRIRSTFGSDYKRFKFYKERCHYFEPKKVVLSTGLNLAGKKIVDYHGYIIPFLHLLKQITALPEMKAYLNRSTEPLPPEGSMMTECIHGSYARYDPYFRVARMEGKKMLYVILNTDDVVLVNPIGLRNKKYKMTVSYITLGNIPAQFRSQRSSMFLLAIARAQNVKKSGGLKNFFADFLKGMEQLREEGIDVPGVGKVYGKLLFSTNDFIAAQQVAGMYQSPNAFAFCRTCNADQQTFKKDRFLKCKNAYSQRLDLEHRARCKQLQDIRLLTNQVKHKNDEEQLKKLKERISNLKKATGINNVSVLQSGKHPIPDLSISNQFVHDTMHCLFQGCFDLHTALFLQECVKADIFSIENLNQMFAEFEWSYLDTANKPLPMLDQKMKNGNQSTLSQTAGTNQMLARVLPIILGDKLQTIRDNAKVEAQKKLLQHYNLWLNLCNIANLALSPYADLTTADQLDELVEYYAKLFKLFYGKMCIVIKLHFLFHLGEQIRRYGPLKHQSCIRFEAKHAQLRQKKFFQFVNVESSIANMVQLTQTYEMLGYDGNFNQLYFEAEGEIKCGRKYNLRDDFPELIPKLETMLGEHQLSYTDVEFNLYEAKSIKLNGLEYRDGAFLTLSEWSEPEPRYGAIFMMLVYKNETLTRSLKYCIVHKYKIDGFSDLHNAYKVNGSYGDYDIIDLHQLKNVFPLPGYRKKVYTLVTHRYVHRYPKIYSVHHKDGET